MKIGTKIVFIVFPLIVAPLLVTGITSSTAARFGITEIATNFLQFKAEELEKYSQSQWTLLEKNNLLQDDKYLQVAKSSIESFALSLIRSPTELILAFDEAGKIVMSTSAVELKPEETGKIRQLHAAQKTGWNQVSIEGKERVAQSFFFPLLRWYVFVTEQQNTFFKAVNQIFNLSMIILSISLLITIILLLLFTRYLTWPLQTVANAMQEIITNNDLSKKVNIQYKDEIGDLSHTFNLMLGELNKANQEIKTFALQSAIAKRREQKIRNIFQKYVPSDVIDQFFDKPESMLQGYNRSLAILFSDIRGFTTISEQLRPDEIVESLNAYFDIMVNIITDRKGIVDKYIGDAIMAFYGAPVKHTDDVYQSVKSALEMVDALQGFNKIQLAKGRPEFKNGIGINYGIVTVGNIGNEKKMDYTVIGDMVNLASRLEGLTKYYPVRIIISESVYQRVSNRLPCRMVDKVEVKGKTEGVGIYSPAGKLTPLQEKTWPLHEKGIAAYFAREFQAAFNHFQIILQHDPTDELAQMYLKRCQSYLKSPPPAAWSGTTKMTEK
jgi:class 3 adenylate cyclase/HAMP domain-containing protein